MIYKTLQFEDAAATCYFIENTPEINIDRKHPCMIICPGGGYLMTSDREAEPMALQYLSYDISCVVLRYSVAPSRFPTALRQLACCVAHVRENAQQYHIDPDKIFIFGGSAGGHLAASLGVFWHRSFLTDLLGLSAGQIKPSGLVLGYPVLSSGDFCHRDSFHCLLGEHPASELMELVSLENQVDENTPRTFLWHTADDDCVPVENTLLFASALSRYHVPFEVHIYPSGIHGLAAASYLTGNYPQINVPHCQDWIRKSVEFVNEQVYFKEDHPY